MLWQDVSEKCLQERKCKQKVENVNLLHDRVTIRFFTGDWNEDWGKHHYRTLKFHLHKNWLNTAWSISPLLKHRGPTLHTVPELILYNYISGPVNSVCLECVCVCYLGALWGRAAGCRSVWTLVWWEGRSLAPAPSPGSTWRLSFSHPHRMS